MIEVVPGNIVAISLGKDPLGSRQLCFEKAQKVIQNHGEALGFDARHHQLVIPKPPYRPGTTERWADKGVHVTVALQDQSPGAGGSDVISEDLRAFHGRPFSLGFDTSTPVLLLGKPANDVAVGAVYYLVVSVDAPTVARIQALRHAMGLRPLDYTFLPHITLAGIAPVDGDFARFRRQWCTPYPQDGFPAPVQQLKLQATAPSSLKPVDVVRATSVRS